MGNMYVILVLFCCLSACTSENGAPSYGELVADLPKVLARVQKGSTELQKIALSDDFLDLISKFSRRNILRAVDNALENSTTPDVLGNVINNYPVFQNLNLPSVLSSLNLSSILPNNPDSENKTAPIFNIPSILNQLNLSSIGLPNINLGSLLQRNETGNKPNPPQNFNLSSLINQFNLSSLLSKFPGSQSNPFAASNSDRFPVSETCRNHTNQMILGLGNRTNWALRMLDASAKIPPDLMNFNLHWYGSFDECRSVKPTFQDLLDKKSSTSGFKGKYCTNTIVFPFKVDIYGTGQPSEIHLIADSCLPDTCSQSDITNLLNSVLTNIKIPGGGIIYGYATICDDQDLELDTRAIIMTVVCAMFGLVMVIGTLYDILLIQWPIQRCKKVDNLTLSGSKYNSSEKYVVSEEKQNDVNEQESYTYRPGIPGKLILAFSVYTNGKKLLSTSQQSGALGAINGIRFLSMSWVILGHTLVLSFTYISNILTYSKEVTNRISFQAIMNALVSVDSFFAISGLLLSYLVLKEMKKNKGKINWFMFYFHRIWRLTPAYMLILGLTTAFASYLYNGPNYPHMPAGSEYDYCAKSFWTNLLYINNFVNLDKQCFGHSWYLANDMQFYILSPLLLLPLYYFNTKGVIAVCVTLLASWITTGVLSNHYQWPPSTLGGGQHGTGDAFNKYYIKPYCRIGPYLVGMIVGYVLYKTDCKVKINRYLNLLGWAVATAAATSVLYGLHDAFNGNPLDNDVSALYVTTHRTVWGAAVCWVVFACATGHGGFINTLLSWKAFIPLSRLTYCAYLIHPLILSVYNQGLRAPWYVTDLTFIYTFLGHLVMSNMVAFVLSLAFESPMMALEKVVFPKKPKK